MGFQLTATANGGESPQISQITQIKKWIDAGDRRIGGWVHRAPGVKEPPAKQREVLTGLGGIG